MIGEAFESVLDAARLGADWAWRRIYDDLAPSLHTYVRLRGAADPDGLVGDVFLEAAKSFDAFDGDERGLRSWLFTIAHSRLIDARRMRERRKTDAVDTADLTHVAARDDVEAEVLERLSSERLKEMMAALAPDQRDVLTLRILADLSVAETAAVLGKSHSSVKVLQHRGLRRLRELTARKV